jgi:hypothetical protein
VTPGRPIQTLILRAWVEDTPSPLRVRIIFVQPGSEDISVVLDTRQAVLETVELWLRQLLAPG